MSEGECVCGGGEMVCVCVCVICVHVLAYLVLQMYIGLAAAREPFCHATYAGVIRAFMLSAI